MAILQERGYPAFLNRDSIKRLQVLALSIRSGYEKHQELLVEKGEDKVVLQLRNRLLGQLFELDQLYQKFGKYLNGYESKEVVDTLQLKYHLKLPEAKTEKILTHRFLLVVML